MDSGYPVSELQHAYATIQDLRDQFGDDGNKLKPSQLIRALNAASRAVDNWTYRRFWADETPVSRVFYPTCRNELRFDKVDIITATGVAIATDDNADGTFTGNWSAASFRLGPDNAEADGGVYSHILGTGIRYFNVMGTRGVLPVRVTARWGWPTVPPEVEQATLLKAAQLFKRKDAPFGVLQFGDIAAVTVTRRDADVIELLSTYQRDVAMVG